MQKTPQPKAIVITGTRSGLGALTAKSLAARGHTVVATMRDASTRNQAKRDGLESFARRAGYQLDAVDLDVTSVDSVADAIARLIEQTDRRPLRTVVMAPGMDFGVERLNQAVSAIQNELLTTLQLGSMV